MAVFEVKNPVRQSAVKPAVFRQVIIPTIPTPASRVIDKLLLKRKWEQDEGGKHSRKMVPMGEGKIVEVRRLMEQINANLEECHVKIHLALVENQAGYAVDVYDCSTGDVCRIIKDITINVDELPALIVKLQQEAGIMLDTVM